MASTCTNTLGRCRPFRLVRTGGTGEKIVESSGSRPGVHDLSFLPTLSIAALLAVGFQVMLNRPGVT